MTTPRILATALVTLAVAAVPATAKPIDPIGTGVPATKGPQDLRTPDTRVSPAAEWSAPSDLRSPDAVADGGTAGTPSVTVVEVRRSPSVGGFEWDDAGLGAGLVLGLGLLGLGGYAVAHRRHGSAIAG